MIGYEFTGTPVYSAPAIETFAPTEAPNGSVVKIHGTNLNDASAVSFGGVAAQGFEVESPTAISATVPERAASGQVSVTTPAGTATSPESFRFQAAEGPPVVDAIAPREGPWRGGTLVTITGSGFVHGATVTIGGVPATSVAVGSATEISAVTPKNTPGEYETIVTDEGGTSTAGPSFTFLPSPAPVVSSVSPDQGLHARGTPIKITGTGFLAGATVNIGGTAAAEVRVRSETEITAVTPPHPVGSYPVVVSDESGTSTGGPDYTFLMPPAPVMTGLSPNSGLATGNNEVTITGSGFQPGASVTFGGVESPEVRVRSETEIIAVTPPHEPAIVAVLVTDEGGTTAPGLAYRFEPALQLFSITPNEGPAKTRNAITLRGTDFKPGLKITIHGKATSVDVVSEREITALTPPDRAGHYTVFLTREGKRAVGDRVHLRQARKGRHHAPRSAGGTVPVTCLDPVSVSGVTLSPRQASPWWHTSTSTPTGVLRLGDYSDYRRPMAAAGNLEDGEVR